jgi:hypothetical protein
MSKRLQQWLAAMLLISMTAFVALPHPVKAQFFDDDSESDFGADSEDEFTEGGGEDGGVAPTSESELTEGDTYADESQQPSATGPTTGGRQSQLRLGAERDVLPLNAAWGAGTGLLIGGWLALISAGSNRDTLRSIGVGIVLGGAVGVAVGLKSVIVPNAPAAAAANSQGSPDKPTWTPLVSFGDGPTRIGVRFTF